MIDLLTFGVILLSFATIGLWHAKRVLSEKAYLLANRTTGLFALTATLVMTEFNTSTLIAFSSMGYLVGLWALTLPAVFLFGLTFYSLVVAKKWKEFNGISVAQFFTKRYGLFVGRLASISLLTAMVGFSAVYVKSLTTLFALLFPNIPFVILSIILVATILFICLRGGLVAVIQTDMLSFILIALLLPIMAYYSWYQLDQTPMLTSLSAPDAALTLPPSFIIAITFITMFTYILAPWYGQKIFAAKNEKVAKTAVLLAAVIVFILYGCAVFATATLRADELTLSSPEFALPHLIQNKLPLGWKGLGYGIFFMAAATTLSGVWSAMTSMIVGDFSKLREKEGFLRCAWITVVFACVSLILSNTLVDHIFHKLILANIPILALSFALLCGFYWKGASTGGAVLSIITGIVWGVGVYLFYGEEGGYQWYWAIYGIPLIFSTGIMGSLIFPQRIPVLSC